MTRRPARPEVKMPEFPLRPGRKALSQRTRLIFVVGLLVAALTVVAAGALLMGSRKTPLRAVTIPVADRVASRQLLLAAEAVNFHPLGQGSGVGTVESLPASAAPAPAGDLLPVGSQAPGFTLRTPTGTAVSLASLRGKTVLLEFFATWCPHCAAEAPHLHDLYASLSRKHYAFAAIDASSADAPSVFAYHVYFGLQFPAVLDPGATSVTFPAHGHPGPVSQRYRVSYYPTFYVLNPRGRIVWRSTGEQPDALLRQELRAATSGAAAPAEGKGTSSVCPGGCGTS
jgi:peroxiredoxin